MNEQTPGTMRFDLTDGRGSAWRLHVSARAIVLERGEQRESIPASEWAGRVSVEPLGAAFVLRFDLSDRQVGFLVSPGQAGAFLAQAGLGPPPSVAPAPSPAPTAGPRLIPGDLPRVQARAVWALALACFAFLPVVGFIVGALAGVLAASALVSSHGKVWLRHNRHLAWAALALAAWSLVVAVGATCALARGTESSRLSVLESRKGDAAQAKDPMLIASSILVILLALSVHEAAHAVTAWWSGDPTARWLGRVSLNPLRHIDPIGTVLLPAILILAGSPVFGWAKPVPVDRSRLRNRRKADMFVSFAGPLSNMLQAGIFLSVLLATGVALRLIDPHAEVQNFSAFWGQTRIHGFAGAGLVAGLATLCKTGILINLLLATLNMIPIPPLDGSWILGNLFPATAGRVIDHVRPYGFIIFVVLLYTNVLEHLLLPAGVAAGLGAGTVFLCTGL